jgi:hypothetical protein
MMDIRVRAVLFVSLLFFLSAPHAHAALLYFDPNSANLFRGDSVTLGLRIDTDEGECINTIDATIHYDASINAVDVSRGDSILNIWVEPPVIDEVNHTIRFAGGLPGGYCGRIAGDPSLTNVVLEIVFQSPGFTIGGGEESKSPHVWIDESSQVLLHDGTGNPAPLQLQDAFITLEDTAGSNIQDTWTNDVRSDNELPSDFSITLTKDDFAFNGEYFIVFNSNDKQSGIDHYEVMEEPFADFSAFKWGRADAPWVASESPYVLKDQTLNSTVRVKAIDKAGNARIVTFVPDTALRSMSRDMLITVGVIGGVVVILSALVFYALWRRRQRLLAEVTDEESV